MNFFIKSKSRLVGKKLNILASPMKITGCVLIILIFLLIHACSSQPVVLIRPDIVNPPVIEDTIQAHTVSDTAAVAVKVVKKDTVLVIKYFPEQEKFYYYIKPDSIIRIDTVVQIQKTESFSETANTLWFYIITILSLITIIAVIYIIIKK